MLEYIRAAETDLQTVYEIVQDSIRTIYPKYYPREVVDFFSAHHSMENIAKDIAAGQVGLLKDETAYVGTGCFSENHITRVYVRPDCQGRGYGTYIMDCLEKKIAKRYSTVCLDASLPASHMYENRGYRTVTHSKWEVENGAVLVYEIMEKSLSEKDIQIHMISYGDEMWNAVAHYAEHCSWRAGAHLAELMKQNRFQTWERVIVATKDGEIVGFCTLTEKDELPEGYDFTPFIGFVFVDEKARGKRISERMIACAADYAKQLGYEKVYVMSGEEGLYEKYGFECIGEYQTVYGWTDQLFVKAIGNREEKA